VTWLLAVQGDSADVVRADGSGPLVSVILPTRDRPGSLCAALESVILQSHRHLEVLVVDDASGTPASDAADAVVRGDRRVRFERLDAPGGAARARNAGLSLASGDFVAFLDDDDSWERQKVERQLEYLGSHSEVGIVSCHYWVVDPHGRRAPIVYRGPASYTAGQVQWMNLPGSFSFVMARRSLLGEELSLDETFPSVEDWDLWLRCVRVAPAGVVPETLARHSFHGGLSKPTSERLGLDAFIRKHGTSMPEACRVFQGAHLRMLAGRGLGHRAEVLRSLATRSPGVSTLLVAEQLARQIGRARRDPGMVARTVAGLVRPDGSTVGAWRHRTR